MPCPALTGGEISVSIFCGKKRIQSTCVGFFAQWFRKEIMIAPQGVNDVQESISGLRKFFKGCGIVTAVLLILLLAGAKPAANDSTGLKGTSIADKASAPESVFSDKEIKLLREFYSKLPEEKIKQHIEELTNQQFELNVRLNQPEKMSKEKQKKVIWRIRHIHQELDILQDIGNKKKDPLFELKRHKVIILAVGGLILLLLVVLFARKRGHIKGGSGRKSDISAEDKDSITKYHVGKQLYEVYDAPDGVDPKPIQEPIPVEPVSSNVPATTAQSKQGSGHYNSNTALPLQDIQSHLDNLLIENPEAYNLLISFLFSQAIFWHASAIHMQRSAGWFEVKFRIDGQLYDICVIDLYREREIINIIKVMAKLKHFESRAAQDGRLEFEHNGKAYDLRISIVPIKDTEKIVARIFGDWEIPYKLENLGLSLKTTEDLEHALNQRSGLILLAGPAGCGKTTTIYAALNYIKDNIGGINISTLEDPVEHAFDGITQIQINPDKDLSFESGLVNLLRQDPEVVMVGEIREAEVAKMVIRAGYTGHGVISTVHSLSTVGAIDRMLEFEVDHYDLHNSLHAVLSQRLVKRLCNNCLEPYSPHPSMIEKAKRFLGNFEQIWQRGKGCDQCMDTGFRGRVVLDELLIIDANARQQLVTMEDRNKRRELLKTMVNHSLFEDGVKKAAAGLTTLEEVIDALGDTIYLD